MKIAFVRGAYLNNFEGQNFSGLPKTVKLTGISSKRPLHSVFPFPVRKLLSLTDFGVPNWLANRTIGDNQCLFGLEETVQEFDIIHTADPHYYYTYQLAKLRRSGKIKKLISTSWETIPFNNESIATKKRIKRFSMKYIDHFICYTDRAKKCLLKEGVKAQKISVIPLGVDLNTFKPAVKPSSLPKNRKIRILFTGRDVPEKGLQDLRTSMTPLLEAGKVELLVAGNIPYDQMADAYRLADIFVMPSKTTETWEEQYGMSLIEAMASGLPIVAYRSGSIPEVLGKSGILVKEGDVKSFTKHLEALVYSLSTRIKLSRLSRSHAEKIYNSRIFSKQITTFYASLLK